MLPVQHKRNLKRCLILKFTLNFDHIYNRVFTDEQQSVYGGGGRGQIVMTEIIVEIVEKNP